ncbi:hypothetical protein SAMN05216223_114118 [Actinacidiphila yanglinensis]|uniref:Uncharacterized protein n=1 Tax=Actinacidiphila yanglinensis TaxID=310779 RepID=A0A1H6DEI1_9ACTN|nr:hypothetical protein [Actinacidiphila yanglinensis]SEG83621.1 hypothetical protein SAMN05216223_114118 [Actinacidiphila yanglinensis]
MSDLWHVSVRRIEGDRVELLVAAVHPDAGPLPATKPFALRLLADAARVWPGAEELVGGIDLNGGDPYGADVEPARRARRVLAEVALTDERNVPFDEAAARRRIEDALRERGLSPDDEAGWNAAFGAEWGGLWSDPDRVPSWVLDIRFADPAALAGLRPGLEWDSAAYG